MAADLITIGVIVVYFLAMLGIGAWASKKIKNTEDYLVAGRQLGFWVFILLMIGTVASGMSLLGVSGLGFKAGWPTIWEQIFVPLSIGFCIIFFGVKLHNVARDCGLYHGAGLPCPPVREPDCAQVPLRSCRHHRLAHLPRRPVLGDRHRPHVALCHPALARAGHRHADHHHLHRDWRAVRSGVGVPDPVHHPHCRCADHGPGDHLLCRRVRSYQYLPCGHEPEPRDALDALRGIRDPVRGLVRRPPDGRACLRPACHQ